MANLINNGIIPLIFKNANDYDDIEEFDEIIIKDAVDGVKKEKIIIENKTKGKIYLMKLEVSDRQKKMLIKGGLINSIKNK